MEKKPDDGHIRPKHVVLIQTLEYTSFIFYTSCVFDYPPTYVVRLHNGDDTP